MIFLNQNDTCTSTEHSNSKGASSTCNSNAKVYTQLVQLEWKNNSFWSTYDKRRDHNNSLLSPVAHNPLSQVDISFLDTRCLRSSKGTEHKDQVYVSILHVHRSFHLIHNGLKVLNLLLKSENNCQEHKLLPLKTRKNRGISLVENMIKCNGARRILVWGM